MQTPTEYKSWRGKYWRNPSFVIKKECVWNVCVEDGELEVKDLLRKMNAIMERECAAGLE